MRFLRCVLLENNTRLSTQFAVGRNFAPLCLFTCINAFMFGYHVHEKAVLLLIVPAIVACAQYPAKYAALTLVLLSVYIQLAAVAVD